MDITDSEEELFLTQNSFSQDILQPNFSLDSIFDPVVGSDEPAPRNSCAEELSKIVSEGSFKDKPKATHRQICIVDDEELKKRKESRIPPNTRKTFADEFIVGTNKAGGISISRDEQG